MARHDIADRSVSLIIFLTDGKPTVGETHTLTILNNTRAAARGRVCIFTIGIGGDVDFQLLEKLSLENCGHTRRVHEDEDAGSQLVGCAHTRLLGARGWGSGETQRPGWFAVPRPAVWGMTGLRTAYHRVTSQWVYRCFLSYKVRLTVS